MVRNILPNRLKSFTHSNSNSRSTSPNPSMKRSNTNEMDKESTKVNGLVLRVVALRVGLVWVFGSSGWFY